MAAAVLPPDPVFTLHSAELTEIHSICFNCYHGDEFLSTGTQNGKVFTWNLKTNRVHEKLTVGQSTILNVYHTINKMYTQEKGGFIKIWNRNESDYSIHTTLESGYCGFCRFHVSDNDELLLCPERNSKINIYTMHGEKITTLTPSTTDPIGEVMCFKYLNIHEGQYLLAGHESGDVYLWDLKAQKTVSHLKMREFPLGIDYDLITCRGVYGNASDNIQVFTISKNDLSMTVKSEIIMKNPGVNSLKIRPDKKVFVSGGWDGRLRVYSWKSLRPLAVLTEHKKPIQDVCFSKGVISSWGSPIMAAGGMDSKITLWDIYN